MDVHSPETRSHNMSKIRGKDTKPELIVRKFLHNNGFRFRLHLDSLPGKPDIVLRKFKTVIQINGCFWHGHEGCKYFIIPETRREWWTYKIYRTREKDLQNNKLLKSHGWEVIVIWECELKTKLRERTLSKLLRKLNNKKSQ